jgi:hypothetical protein
MSRWGRAALPLSALMMMYGTHAAAQEITPAASAVTASTNDGNTPANTVDNNLGTRWSGNGDGQWVQLDLGTARSVGSVGVAVYQGNARQNRFDIQVSSCCGTWTTVWSGQSSGTTTAEQNYDFTDVTARWVRYLGHGNVGSANTSMNSVTEISIFAGGGGTSPTATPTPTSPGATPTPTPTPRVVAPTATPTPTPTPGGSGPTTGWTQMSWTYTMHKPWNVSLSDRFSYSNGIWTCWLFPGDEPFQPPPKEGGPRTELRWQNDYTSGQRMWDGDIWVVSPTESTITQLFGGSESSTSHQIRSFRDGTLRRYNAAVLVTNAFGRWINAKFAHNTSTNVVYSYINDQLIRQDPDRGEPTNVGAYYFKNGLYGCAEGRCESRFRNLRQWRR